MSDASIAHLEPGAPVDRAVRKLPLNARRCSSAADIWVLTETRASISPDDGSAAHAEPHPERRPTKMSASIWSRSSHEPIESSRWAVAARRETPQGDVVVYGTVPWYAHERRRRMRGNSHHEEMATTARLGDAPCPMRKTL